jgi:preprotein translocase YajC subunit
VNHLLLFGTTLLAASSKKTTTSGSSATFLIFIVVVVGALYFLFLRPNQQKARRQREENAAIEVGDQVVTIGGIVGRVESMDGDRVVLVTGHEGPDGVADDWQGTRMSMLRSAVSRKLQPPAPEPEEPEGEDAVSPAPDPREQVGKGSRWWPGAAGRSEASPSELQEPEEGTGA